MEGNVNGHHFGVSKLGFSGLKKSSTLTKISQYEALKKVNRELIGLYWQIGKAIVERQEQHEWGKSIVETLSKDLMQEYPGVQGYSAVNLWRMRKFYLEYRDDAKLSPMVREIGWSHNTVIIDKCKEALEREFYIKMTKKFGWTKSVLTHQIEGKAYQRSMTGQTNFDKTLEEKYRAQAHLAVKDTYHFDFLGLSEDYSERELEMCQCKHCHHASLNFITHLELHFAPVKFSHSARYGMLLNVHFGGQALVLPDVTTHT